MCDSPNTTDIIETECYICGAEKDCNMFKDSYINRCNWRRITPSRCDDDNNCDGVCTDGMDYVQAGFSPFVALVGWLLFVYGLGWLRKERGKFSILRRHGVQVTADMVARHTDTVEIPTAGGLPDLTMLRFWATVQWRPLPPPQSTCKGFFLNPRRGACDRLIRQYLCWCQWNPKRLSRHALQPWQRLMNTDGLVKVDLQLTEKAYDAYKKDVTTIRIVYDPFDDQNWVSNPHHNLISDPRKDSSERLLACFHQVLPAAALMDGVNRIMVVAIMICAGVSLVAMGTIMTADAFHCGPDFWGFPECCDTCVDWTDLSPVRSSIVFRLFWTECWSISDCFWSSSDRSLVFRGLSLVYVLRIRASRRSAGAAVATAWLGSHTCTGAALPMRTPSTPATSAGQWFPSRWRCRGCR